MNLPLGQRNSPFYTEQHTAFREQVRRFVAKEIVPNASKWDEEEQFPRDLYQKAAQVGVLQAGFPDEYGGVAGDRFFSIIVQQELSRGGSGGVVAGLANHRIVLPTLVRAGSEALKKRVIPEVLSGVKIAALACTEPTGGSDVANIRTTARCDGDHFVISGEKTFISSGMRADFIVVVVRTGGPGAKGLSLLLVDGDVEGLARTPLKKMGWLPLDTVTLYFDRVRVPAANLIGAEGSGFSVLAANFNDERLGLAASSIAFAALAYEEALTYARSREAFGKMLIQHQVIRHKLIDMAQRISASQAFLELSAWRMDQGEDVVADLCMLKNQATQTFAFCASEAVQIFGGAGYLRGAVVERLYREVKVNAIGGGTEEIMKELAAKQIGF
jgi:acyl-CoA dehydrogenase